MPEVHSKFSPSAADRWMACPGSLDIGEESDTPSAYAAEGTVAHSVASSSWLLGVEPEYFIGKTFNQDGFDIVVNEEMTDAVSVYLELINAAEGDIRIEQRLVHQEYENFGGTIDCAIVDRHRIIDYKHGVGHVVEVDQNPQLACYALLYIDRFHNRILTDVEVTIVQPRATHVDGPVRTWVATAEFLQDFRDRLFEIFEGSRKNELHAGSHCRWCPHRAQCPELYELTLKTAKAEFNEPGMTAEKASEILQSGDAIKTYLEAVEQWAHGQMEKGVLVPNYKLVERLGNRRYCVSEEEIVRRCRNAKFGKKQIYTTELLSPAQLEKVVGDKVVASLVERPVLGTTVVPITDKRLAVKRLTASEEFANENLEDLETVS